MKRQPVSSQKGEIEFRKKLVEQQVDGKHNFEDEFDKEGIENILTGRMKKTFEKMIDLKENHFPMTPYLEIGAERCQRSLVMENDVGQSGAAVDISFEMLRSSDHYLTVFNKSTQPLRVCADANTLPFLTDSIPFVFCYETLHHFPHPAPVTAEIHRVLSPGGAFFFDEEPFKRVLHYNLYKAQKSYSREKLGSGKFRKVLDHFFSEESCNEVEHGIIENGEITLGDWKSALRGFEENEVTLRPGKKIASTLYGSRNWLKFIIAYLAGGEISGLCKKGGASELRYASVVDALACPSCRQEERDSSLRQAESSFACNTCGEDFPVVDGVAFLLTRPQLEILYPDIVNAGPTKIGASAD